ncbi:MAG: 3-deoxy-7-phosphoheptulonate synthase [Chloroflexota bacterium]|nr:3-deoxy-7-phosphoheptulonate synthase [Chloroflexota bacterium]MDE2840360.1 3-deoxy-7-phosphoheptulonate synthase [Chloroflexota bacterium]MDE2929355.1 3-deoxy-7-phosphoheptulonate synthase [Chloroflexota bacterium]
MIVIMRTDAIPEQIDAVRERIEEAGVESTISQGVNKTVIGLIGKRPPGIMERVQVLPGVEMVIPVDKPYKFAARGEGGGDTHIRVGNVTIGSNDVAIIGGPCSVESEEQIVYTAQAVKEAGGHILRGGAFKPRTSPYSFQGMRGEGLKLLRTAADATGLPLITEVMDPRRVPLVAEYVDILQIGARNMQNFTLLQEVGNTDKPVLLKRGMAASIEDLLMSAEYIMAAGNMRVILCERGIRTFETATRNTLDLSAIPVIKEESHLPVVIDPSHATGRWELVKPMALAAVAAGADGVMIEVHPNPELALSDGPQSVTPARFFDIMDAIRKVAAAVGRELPAATAEMEAATT